DAVQWTARVAEIVDGDDVALAQDLARERAGEREAAAARLGQWTNRGDDFSFTGDGFHHRGAVAVALRGARGAQRLEQRWRVGHGGELPREDAKGFAILGC